jgi:serine/threonine-protein kinase/endoribonuclease IRE1
LAGYLAGKYSGPPLSAHTILLQISQGLQHLHSLGVIHRGLKPNNVLICTETQTNPQLVKQVQIKLSDFGVMAGSSSGDSWPCSDRDSVEGWLAPEQIKTLGLSTRAVTTTVEAGSTLQRQKSGAQLQLLTPAVDVFALGCLFFCVLTSGQHPFGSPSYFRDQRALGGQYELAPLSLQLPPAAILIERMIQRDPDYRPTIDNILAQSNFWSLDI